MQMDKETQIKSLKENKEALEGKVKFLQDTCRRAGAQIKKLEAEYKSLYKDKWEYYQGNLPDEDLKERGWDPFQLKVLKSDLSTYIDSDKDIINHMYKIEYQKEKIDFLDSVIRNINNRGLHIKNAIDWEKFKVGI
mgnify:CR=1 FL=1